MHSKCQLIPSRVAFLSYSAFIVEKGRLISTCNLWTNTLHTLQLSTLVQSMAVVFAGVLCEALLWVVSWRLFFPNTQESYVSYIKKM
jgi:hypothetical protein